VAQRESDPVRTILATPSDEDLNDLSAGRKGWFQRPQPSSRWQVQGEGLGVGAPTELGLGAGSGEPASLVTMDAKSSNTRGYAEAAEDGRQLVVTSGTPGCERVTCSKLVSLQRVEYARCKSGNPTLSSADGWRQCHCQGVGRRVAAVWSVSPLPRGTTLLPHPCADLPSRGDSAPP
jgi:hypothetical protein